jgi:hypothetical protein
MVSKSVKRFCKDYTNIENYDKAMGDLNVTWECHHRLELESTGGLVDLTTQGLKDFGLYYNRPADELIFLKPDEHRRLHMSSKIGKEQRRNFTTKGKQHSEEAKKKMSEAAKGRHWNEEQKKMLSEVTRHWKVKHWKLVDGKRVWY